MKILYAAYRSWAKKAVDSVLNRRGNLKEVWYATTKSEFDSCIQHNQYDLIVLVGWSWIVPEEIVDSTFVACFHPSKLAEFAGGSPIQHQIDAGIKQTQSTLFKVTNDGIDAGPIVTHYPISLEGSLEDVFASLSRAAEASINFLLDEWPSVTLYPQSHRADPLKRLTPSSGDLVQTGQVKIVSTCRSIYDRIRGRTDPYPNAYIEDETGRLYFEKVRFEPK